MNEGSMLRGGAAAEGRGDGPSDHRRLRAGHPGTRSTASRCCVVVSLGAQGSTGPILEACRRGPRPVTVCAFTICGWEPVGDTQGISTPSSTHFNSRCRHSRDDGGARRRDDAQASDPSSARGDPGARGRDGDGAAAQTTDEVRIGIVSPLTGPAAKFGQAQKNAMTMAAEDVNNAGGIKSLGGAKIKLFFGDTRGEADTGVTETERLITRDKVHALIGAFQSGVGFPSSAMAEKHQVPWLTFGTFDKITERGFKYVFRAHANDTHQGQDAHRRPRRARREGGADQVRGDHEREHRVGEVGRREAEELPREARREGALRRELSLRGPRPHLAHRQGQGGVARSGRGRLLPGRRAPDHPADGGAGAAAGRVRRGRRRPRAARLPQGRGQAVGGDPCGHHVGRGGRQERAVDRQGQ